MPNTAKDIKIKKEDFKIQDVAPEPAVPRVSMVPKSASLIQELNHLLADEYTVFTKTLNYHWNIEGPRFNSLHEFLDTQYRELLDVVDNLAERIRKLDARAIGTLREFQSKTTIVEAPGKYPEPQDMLRDLLRDHETLQFQIKQLLKHKSVDPGTEDFLTGLLRKHEDMTWRLKSHFQ